MTQWIDGWAKPYEIMVHIERTRLARLGASAGEIEIPEVQDYSLSIMSIGYDAAGADLIGENSVSGSLPGVIRLGDPNLNVRGLTQFQIVPILSMVRHVLSVSQSLGSTKLIGRKLSLRKIWKHPTAIATGYGCSTGNVNYVAKIVHWSLTQKFVANLKYFRRLKDLATIGNPGKPGTFGTLNDTPAESQKETKFNVITLIHPKTFTLLATAQWSGVSANLVQHDQYQLSWILPISVGWFAILTDPVYDIWATTEDTHRGWSMRRIHWDFP